MRILLLALMMTVVTEYATPAPYEQKIEGTILKCEAPAVQTAGDLLEWRI